MNHKEKAFTLTELLVVVIVLGVLAAVAVPKFTRVLETRKTTEAEELLSAVRTEQEHRCTMGRPYTVNRSVLPMTAQTRSAHFSLDLQEKGAVAARGDDKNYELRVLYKDGGICCSGSGCDSLNKAYPRCGGEWGLQPDECAASGASADPVLPPASQCELNPNDCACAPYAAAHQCECNPSTSTCCEEGEEWNPQTKQCDATCTEKTQYIGAASASEADTCPGGDKTAKYTCDGIFKGTCVDVYSSRSAASALASYAVDPFWNFDGALAQSITAGQCPTYMITCPQLVPTHRQYCCPKGSQCKSIGNGEYDCVTGDPGLQPEELCVDGYHKDKNGICVPDTSIEDPDIDQKCMAGYEWDAASKQCLPSAAEECPAGCSWDSLLGACSCPSIGVELYQKRQVTCCGTGGEVPFVPAEETCEQNPNQQKCCVQGEEWNGSACVETCESNPNQQKCCVQGEEWNGSACIDPCKENPKQEKCCAEDQLWTGFACETCVTKSTDWMDSGPTEDTCDGDADSASSCPLGLKGTCIDVRKGGSAEYDYKGAQETIPTDTCDGNITQQYTCKAGESKACVDVIVSAISSTRDNRTMGVKQTLTGSTGVDRTMPNCPASGSCADLSGTECYYEDGPYRAIKACYYQNVQTAQVKCGDKARQFRQLTCCGK